MYSRYPQPSDLKGFIMVRSQQNSHTFTVIYVRVKSNPGGGGGGQTPGHLTFRTILEQNSPQCCQFLRSNARPVGTSQNVKHQIFPCFRRLKPFYY